MRFLKIPKALKSWNYYGMATPEAFAWSESIPIGTPLASALACRLADCLRTNPIPIHVWTSK
jgi:hypothetical protein